MYNLFMRNANTRRTETATLTTDLGEITAPVTITTNKWGEIVHVFVRTPTVNTSGWNTESARAGVRLAVEDGRIRFDGAEPIGPGLLDLGVV